METFFRNDKLWLGLSFLTGLNRFSKNLSLPVGSTESETFVLLCLVSLRLTLIHLYNTQAPEDDGRTSRTNTDAPVTGNGFSL